MILVNVLIHPDPVLCVYRDSEGQKGTDPPDQQRQHWTSGRRISLLNRFILPLLLLFTNVPLVT